MNDDDHRDPSQGQDPGGDEHRPEDLRDSHAKPHRADGSSVEGYWPEHAPGDGSITDLPEGSAQQIEAVFAQYATGPLPVSGEFGGYENILPGSADRILTMAEEQSNAQSEGIKANAQVQRSIADSIIRNGKRKDREQWIFAVLAFAALGAALVFAWNDKPIPAVVGLIVLAAAGYEIGRGGSDSQFINPVPGQVETPGD